MQSARPVGRIGLGACRMGVVGRFCWLALVPGAWRGSSEIPAASTMEMSLSAADHRAIAEMLAELMAEPLLYSVAAAAKALDLSEPSFRRLVKEGKFVPFTGHGLDRTQVTRTELERFVAGEPVPQPSPAQAPPASGSFRLVGV